MTNHEMREAIRQMLADWNAAPPEARAAALEEAHNLARRVTPPYETRKALRDATLRVGREKE